MLRFCMFHGRLPLAHQDLHVSTNAFGSLRFDSSMKRAITSVLSAPATQWIWHVNVVWIW